MKKLISYGLLIILIFNVCLVVNAQDYEKNTLIPVDTVATVSTDKFDYQNFTYNSSFDSKGNTFISFGTIQNNKMTKEPVSVNILLFGQDQKNIGFLTYCSDKDVSSNYAGFKLGGNQSSPFSITVTSKYFVTDKGPRDVKYIAIMDENKYCQIGGYDRYKDLTIDQISGSSGENKEDNNDNNNKMFDILKFFEDSEIMPIVLDIAIGLVTFIILGFILNALHKKMYAKKTLLAYIPVANFYLAAKMAFGNIVAIIFGILLVISGGLYYLGMTFMVYVVSFIFGLSFIVVIIKLVTKKYDLFYFEPAIKTATFKADSYTPNTSKIETTSTKSSDNKDNNKSLAEQVIDLSYDDINVDEDDDSDDDNFNLDDDSFNVSSGNSHSDDSSVNNDDNGESDLNKFFH